MTPPSPAASRPLGGAGLVLLLGALTAFGPLSIDMYLPAFPAIARDLGASPSAVQFTLSSFFVGLALGQLVTGPLIDHFGRTRPLRFGLALYVLGSLGCGLAPSAPALVGLRFVQALGGAVSLVVSRAVVRDLHSGAAAARMMSRLVLVMGAAPILAPQLGGALLLAFGWRSIFLTLALFAAVALGVAWWRLPETAPVREGPAQPLREARVLLRSADFTGHALAVALAFAGMFAYIAGAAFVFIELHHLSPAHFTWLFGANAAGYVLASQVNHRLLARVSGARLLSWGLRVALAAGAVLVVLALTGRGGVWGLAACLLVFVSSLGLVGPNATAAALEHHRERAGLASAVLGFTQSVVAASASAAVGLLNDGTAKPMASVLLVAVALGWLALHLGWRAARAQAPRAEGSAPA